MDDALSLLGIIAFFSIIGTACYVMDHGLEAAAAKVGDIIKIFRQHLN